MATIKNHSSQSVNYRSKNHQHPIEMELNEKIQLVLSLMKSHELEHFCPHAIRRKMLALSRCPLGPNSHQDDRMKIMRTVIALGNRVAFELLVKHSNSHRIISSLWVAVRNRGCQFLGPAIQEEVLKLVILALGDGTQLTRKVLVLYILQRMEKIYPLQATKTSVGHVVQILYRASCFEIIKRPGESCLMQLKEQYRKYIDLRREHDAQIISMALESGIRLSPEQWSSLLYGDQRHKSHMQSIIDKLNATNAPFDRLVDQLAKTLAEEQDFVHIADTIVHFRRLVQFEQHIEDENTCCFSNIIIAIDSIIFIVTRLITFITYIYGQTGTYSLYKNPMKNHFI